MGGLLPRALPSFFCLLGLAGTLSAAAPRPVTIAVVPFHNRSQYPDLNWVGESAAETLMNEFRDVNEIVLDRDARAEGMRRLSLRPAADFTIATLIHLGQTLGADYVCYGSYDVDLPAGESELRNSSIRLTAMFLDLRNMHEGPEISEAGKLAELSRLEEHLAWQSLNYLVPAAHFDVNQFLAPSKLVRVDAEESYIRGLLSQNNEQRQKWLVQALAVDPKFTGPAFELGKLALSHNDYRQAIGWFEKIPPADPRYFEARFKMGLGAYGAGDYTAAAGYFTEVSKSFPLNEVYNNLGASEIELKSPAAVDDLKRAVDGDPNDSTYLFNLGLAQLQNKQFDAAAKRFQQVLDKDPDDFEAQTLLTHAQQQDPAAARERLKKNFQDTAFRQLKAVLQSKSE
jgi:tetratricopeptide (TPR) repeat protein